MLLWDLLEDGATEADQEVEEQEGDKEEEGESCNFIFDITVVVFSFSMIF